MKKFLILATFILVAVTVHAVTRTPVATWEGMRQATCMPFDCFTERVHDLPIRQPLAAWTSLAFIVVGISILFHKHLKFEKSPSRWDTLMWLAMMVTGLGSFFYHASLVFVGQAVDVVGMYLIVIAITLTRADRVLKLSTRNFYTIYTLSAVSTTAAQIFLSDVRRFLFFALVLVVIGNEVFLHRKGNRSNMRHFYIALLLLASGFAFWLVDRFRILGSPDSLFQGHALWHLLSAASAWQVYKFVLENNEHQLPALRQAKL